MASRTSLSSVKLFLLFVLSSSAVLSHAAKPMKFRVGGPLGWRKPTGFESETYNHWAGRNRFHIGDSLYFKYEKDSVLVVDYGHYGNCNVTKPLMRFNDSNTMFRLERFGYFYFISGEPGHCQAGQKLIVRVMVHPEMANLAPAPAPIGEPDDGSNSTFRSGSGSTGSWRIVKTVFVVAVSVIGLAWKVV